MKKRRTAATITALLTLSSVITVGSAAINANAWELSKASCGPTIKYGTVAYAKCVLGRPSYYRVIATCSFNGWGINGYPITGNRAMYDSSTATCPYFWDLPRNPSVIAA